MTTHREGRPGPRPSDLLPVLPLLPLRGGRDDLRAMKRALARAPLGPTATLALTHAILDLENELARPDGRGDDTR